MLPEEITVLINVLSQKTNIHHAIFAHALVLFVRSFAIDGILLLSSILFLPFFS
jgi:hypothetical protein